MFHYRCLYCNTVMKLVYSRTIHYYNSKADITLACPKCNTLHVEYIRFNQLQREDWIKYDKDFDNVVKRVTFTNYIKIPKKYRKRRSK